MSKLIKCPKCASKSLSALKKRFGFGKVVVGTIITDKTILTCLKCGHKFKHGRNNGKVI